MLTLISGLLLSKSLTTSICSSWEWECLYRTVLLIHGARSSRAVWEFEENLPDCMA